MAGDQPATSGDPRFHVRRGPFSVAEIARAAGGEARSPGETQLSGVAPLQMAGPGEVTFLEGKRYLHELATTRAGAVIVSDDTAAQVPAGCVAIVVPAPHEAWARVVTLFHPWPDVMPGIHPTAAIDPAARVDPTCEVAPYAVISADAEIGPETRIGPHAVIGHGVVIGRECHIGPHVSVQCAILGNRVKLFPGARIGQDGFGFAVTRAGFLSVPQIGRVVLGDDVEIGANTTVDRGSLGDTVIAAGSRLDNLVQVGHNVAIGRACVIVSQAGISGSSVLEDNVMLGGQAGLVGHLKVGRGARIAAQAGVIGNVPANMEMVGAPALPAREFFRIWAVLRRLGRGRDRHGLGWSGSGAQSDRD